jgi:starvation-inducible DNA-binding protein
MGISTTGTDLQDTLVELADLALLGKQLHWNVAGRHFRTVHEQLDELVGVARAITVAKDSPLPDVPEGRVSDVEAVDLVVAALRVTTGRIEERIRRIADLDPVSQDLLIGVAADLEKQQWMFSAQQG